MPSPKCHAPLSGVLTINKPLLPNSIHSIQQRLKNRAREQEEDYQTILSRYANERFLYRLGISIHKERFILKGGNLFLLWKQQPYRATQDIDFLALDDTSLAAACFKDICAVDCDDQDGMIFLSDSIKSKEMKEDERYPGTQISLQGKLGKIELTLKFDIGFGDAVSPLPQTLTFPTLLEHKAPEILAYTPYTMIAEKLEAIVKFGIRNTRFKDFFDIWLAFQLFSLDGRQLSITIVNTFSRRSTALPDGIPAGLTENFALDLKNAGHWRAFIKRTRPKIGQDLSFELLAHELKERLMPVLEHHVHERTWIPGQGWC